MTSRWNPFDEPIDFVLIGGQKTPGIADVEEAGSPRAWDERRGYGLSGATLVFRGLELAAFKVLVRLYTAEDWAAWHDFAPIVARPPEGERATALDVTHPLLEAVGIHAAVVTDLVQPKQTRDGEWTIEIRMKEFRSPVVAVTPVDASTTAATEAPQSDEQRLIARLAAQVEFEAKGFRG